MGVHTIGDLAAFDRDALVGLLGKQGATLHDYATGAEHAPVIPASQMPPPKSVGSGLTFPKDLLGWEELQAGVALLSDDVAARLRRLDMKCATVSIAVRAPDFSGASKQKGLDTPTYLAREVSQAAMALLRQFWDARSPVRALTVTAQSLLPADAAPQRDKVEKLERAMDGIRGKFGQGAISTTRTSGRSTRGKPIPPGPKREQ